MLKRTASGIMVIFLLIGMLTLAFNIHLVKASGTIYIRADGSIDPPTAPITTSDNIVYAFADNISDSIVVQRSNIIIDGIGHTLLGFGSGYGFNLTGVSNVTIQNTLIKNFGEAIHAYQSSITVRRNKITNNSGIITCWVGFADIFENNITNNARGISFATIGLGGGGSVIGNNIAYSGGISFSEACVDIFENNITNSHGDAIFFGEAGASISGNIIANNNGSGIRFQMAVPHITDNYIVNNTGDGIYFRNAIGEISSNYIGNNGGNGILGIVPGCMGSNISDNNIIENGENGIYLRSPEDHHNIAKNRIVGNNKGICLDVSPGGIMPNSNNMFENHLENNQVGIYLNNCFNNVASANTIVSSDCGIHLYSSSNNSVSQNNIANNIFGIEFCDSCNNTISSNEIISNICGTIMYPIDSNTSNSNYIFNNYFANGINAADSGSNYWNTSKTLGTNIMGGPYLGGNYWNDYLGVDTDGDGIGDTNLPHNCDGYIKKWWRLASNNPMARYGSDKHDPIQSQSV